MVEVPDQQAIQVLRAEGSRGSREGVLMSPS